MFDDFYLELNGLQAKHKSSEGATAGSSKDLLVKTKVEMTRSVEMIQDIEFHTAAEDTSVVTNFVLIKKNKNLISKIVRLLLNE